MLYLCCVKCGDTRLAEEMLAFEVICSMQSVS
jgi:hypothetical protein